MTLEANQELREKIIQLLKGQKEEERLAKSRQIGDKLFKIPPFEASQTVLFYASFEGEVDTFDMIKRSLELNKKVALPVVYQEEKKIIPVGINSINDLYTGAYGILEPKHHKDQEIHLSQLDAVIVPGIAFDQDNHRLGRGAGYYDRFLSQLSSQTPTFGLAFDFQCVERIPCVQSHDQAVSFVVTE